MNLQAYNRQDSISNITQSSTKVVETTSLVIEGVFKQYRVEEKDRLDKVESRSELNDPFYLLRLTAEDKKNIEYVFDNLANKNYMQLLFIQATLKEKEKELKGVHPIRFIAYILSEPSLRENLITISKDSLKYKEFTENFERQMEEENSVGNLLLYASGFSDFLQVDLQMVLDILKTKKYANLYSL